jgi:hypothetical protein
MDTDINPSRRMRHHFFCEPIHWFQCVAQGWRAEVETQMRHAQLSICLHIPDQLLGGPGKWHAVRRVDRLRCFTQSSNESDGYIGAVTILSLDHGLQIIQRTELRRPQFRRGNRAERVPPFGDRPLLG